MVDSRASGNRRTGSRLTFFASIRALWSSIGTSFKTKPRANNRGAASQCSVTHFRSEAVNVAQTPSVVLVHGAWADPQPHERVAVVGIGGLGHLAVQYAKAA